MGGPLRKLILRAFVARWYANVLQLHKHTRLEIELEHGRGGARSRAGCPPSESSGDTVHVQPTETRSAHYTFKFSDKPLAYNYRDPTPLNLIKVSQCSLYILAFSLVFHAIYLERSR